VRMSAIVSLRYGGVVNIRTYHPTRSTRPRSGQLRLSPHAELRAAQRNLSYEDLVYVYRWGRSLRLTGIVFYTVGRRDVPQCDRHSSELSRLVGTTLLVSHDNVVITVIRNERYIRKLRYKSKRKR